MSMYIGTETQSFEVLKNSRHRLQTRLALAHPPIAANVAVVLAHAQVEAPCSTRYEVSRSPNVQHLVPEMLKYPMENAG